MSRGEGAEVYRAVVLHPAGDVYLGKFLGAVNLDVGVGLVVLQPGVEGRTVLLDEGVLQDESLRRRVGDDEVVVGHAGQHPANLRLVVSRGGEVGAEAGAQVRRLAHVERPPLFVLHLVDAGADGRDAKPVSQRRDGHEDALADEEAEDYDAGDDDAAEQEDAAHLIAHVAVDERLPGGDSRRLRGGGGCRRRRRSGLGGRSFSPGGRLRCGNGLPSPLRRGHRRYAGRASPSLLPLAQLGLSCCDFLAAFLACHWRVRSFRLSGSGPGRRGQSSPPPSPPSSRPC